MFDNVGRGQKQSAGRSASSLVLTLLINGSIFGLMVWAGAKAVAEAKEEPPPMVAVSMDLPPPPPPPPPPAGGKKREKKPDVTPEDIPVMPELLPEEVPEPVTDEEEGEVGETDGVKDGVADGVKDGVVGNPLSLNPVIRTVHWSEIQVKTRVSPAFPEAAQQLGLKEEKCIVHIIVNEAGRADDISFKACPELFKSAAREAAQKWEWYPLTDGGQPIKAQFDINFLFRLK